MRAASSLWAKAGDFKKALAKAPKVTTWIWKLHSDPHDFHTPSALELSSNLQRKIFASNFAHLSLVFFWLSGMHFHGAYFSNFIAWLKDPKDVFPGAQLVSPILGQDLLNSDLGGFFQALNLNSGFFQLWRSEGLVTSLGLKAGSLASLTAAIFCLAGSFFHMHLSSPSLSFFKKFRALSSHHLSLLFGLGSLSWAGHLIHISLPENRLLDSGLDSAMIPSAEDLLFGSEALPIPHEEHVGRYHRGGLWLEFFFMSSFSSGYDELGLNESFFGAHELSQPFLAQVTGHHLALALVLVGAGLLSLYRQSPAKTGLRSQEIPAGLLTRLVRGTQSWHSQLSVNLALLGSFSFVFSHHVSALRTYAFIASDYPTVLSLFSHHFWIGAFLILGAGAHGSISILEVPDLRILEDSGFDSFFQELLNHRDLILGHLLWVTIGLGLHSFGLYIHNDSLQALGRPEDSFSDKGIQLKPVFALWLQSSLGFLAPWLEIYAGTKVLRITQELATADFLVHHIHAFTIHTSLLILVKAGLFARSSRLLVEKSALGFRYPCDGPGRGGTCQISPWDHIYLGVFWAYNSIAVAIFHFFWKMQSDVWGVYDLEKGKLMHLTGGDFSVNATSINGWLRNFLWSEASQVIQSYGTSVSGYGLIFLGAHWVWALSLMFLYSGRGYWQELLESVLWAHGKLKILPQIQPRALSISQGRAVGLVHYILGGVGTTWGFFISRILVLSS
jgi:photosystem I P700 chlorophyll a apoprotein A1